MHYCSLILLNDLDSWSFSPIVVIFFIFISVAYFLLFKGYEKFQYRPGLKRIVWSSACGKLYILKVNLQLIILGKYCFWVVFRTQRVQKRLKNFFQKYFYNFCKIFVWSGKGQKVDFPIFWQNMGKSTFWPLPAHTKILQKL